MTASTLTLSTLTFRRKSPRRCANRSPHQFRLRVFAQTRKEVRVLTQLPQKVPFLWLNEKAVNPAADLANLPLSLSQMEEAHERWQRLAPVIEGCFPECPGGAVESPLTELDFISRQYSTGFNMQPRTFMKQDNLLPICGSVKARGGVYEVLKLAESLALEAGLLEADTCRSRMLTDDKIVALLSQHTVAVGSTGNLGLSVGIAAAAVGMQATVHMSRDAVQWKKALLRSKGVQVVEHLGGYSQAVAAGREAAAQDPRTHFVDDESSEDLMLGYSTSAYEVVRQLRELNMEVSDQNPLVVHIPCGVGGAPAGICWGLHQLLGNKVRVLFAEPTNAPCMLLGLQTGYHDRVSVLDIGLSGQSAADGLAVDRPSGLACAMMERLVAGIYTVRDEDMYRGLAQLLDLEGVFVEPSCATTLMGPAALSVLANAWEPGSGPFDGRGVPGRETAEFLLQEGIHLLWMTGGSMVPEEEQQRYNQLGLELLRPDANLQQLLAEIKPTEA